MYAMDYEVSAKGAFQLAGELSKIGKFILHAWDATLTHRLDQRFPEAIARVGRFTGHENSVLRVPPIESLEGHIPRRLRRSLMG